MTAAVLAAAWSAVSAEIVFEDDFNGFADGETPTSIVELRDTPWQRAEVIGKRYAIHAGGNTHRLITPDHA